METRTIHFSVGEDMGKTLMNIAQEHILYSHNPLKALKSLTDSMIDCPQDLALKILKGDYVIHVDVDTQEFLVGERNDNDGEYPQLDIKNWYIRKSHEILKNGEYLRKAIKEAKIKMRYCKVKLSFDYGQILSFISGDRDYIIDEIMELEEVSEIALLVKVVKSYIEESTKIQSTMDWLRKTYPSEFNGEDLYVPDWREYNTILQTVIQDFSSFCKTDFSDIETEEDELTKYIDATNEINEVLSESIVPVDIMDNYSAGWLNPDGLFYGLNGEIANMLHNQIGDALQDIGIIPLYVGDEEEKYFLKGDENTKAYRKKVNPDSWLEQQGWVKIHGNNVQFAGCLNKDFRKENVNMTETQIDIIYKYLQVCHKGIVRLGWKQEALSAARFQMIAKGNMFKLNKDYFEF